MVVANLQQSPNGPTALHSGGQCSSPVQPGLGGWATEQLAPPDGLLSHHWVIFGWYVTLLGLSHKNANAGLLLFLPQKDQVFHDG